MISVQCFQKDTFRKKGDKGCNEGEGKKGQGYMKILNEKGGKGK